jgi:monoamine oxidase
MDTVETGVLDVAIIGAGASGLYSGWRLLTSPRMNGQLPHAGQEAAASSVVLFEASNRVGGRLLTLVPPGMPEARVEVGGMRFTSAHVQVAGLVEYLGLKTEPFVVARPENLAYVRGKRLHTSDLADADRIPYNLAPSDVAGLVDGITALAAVNFLKEVLHTDHVDLSKVDWPEVARTGRFEGQKLTDISMRYVFARCVGHEAFEYAYDTSGYDSIFFTWSAADGFPWNLGDFGAVTTYSHVTDGYLTVLLELQKHFEQAGGRVELNHSLRRFDTVELEDGTTGVALEFENGVRVQARSAILGMPRRSIELLEQTGAVLDRCNTEVHELVQSVTPIPLFKLALAYETRWWEPLGITAGQTVTDLPIRQCYYWNVESASGAGVILIYDDGQDLDFWASLRSLRHNEAYARREKAAPTGGLPDWDEYPAPKLMVEEAHRQLMEIHGLEPSEHELPYAAAYMDWGADPYGGGANFWSLHVDSQSAARRITQPKPGVPVYICGDAYSHQQGWVEGALATAEDVLQRHMQLAPAAPPLVSPPGLTRAHAVPPRSPPTPPAPPTPLPAS